MEAKTGRKLHLTINTDFDEREFEGRYANQFKYLESNSEEDLSMRIPIEQSKAILVRDLNQTNLQFQQKYLQRKQPYINTLHNPPFKQSIDSINQTILVDSINIKQPSNPKQPLTLQQMLDQIRLLHKNLKNQYQISQKTSLKKKSNCSTDNLSINFKQLRKQIQQTKKVIKSIKSQRSTLKLEPYRNSQRNNGLNIHNCQLTKNKSSLSKNKFNYITYSYPQYQKPYHRINIPRNTYNPQLNCYQHQNNHAIPLSHRKVVNRSANYSNYRSNTQYNCNYL